MSTGIKWREKHNVVDVNGQNRRESVRSKRENRQEKDDERQTRGEKKKEKKKKKRGATNIGCERQTMKSRSFIIYLMIHIINEFLSSTSGNWISDECFLGQ